MRYEPERAKKEDLSGSIHFDHPEATSKSQIREFGDMKNRTVSVTDLLIEKLPTSMDTDKLKRESGA